MTPETAAIIARAQALPKDWRVTTHYADGSVKTHDTHAAGAQNWAIGERRKIGRDLIDRATGNKVHVASVSIDNLGAN